MPEPYEIRVEGHLGEQWASWLGDTLTLRHDPVGETILSGQLDQAALQGVLIKIRDLGLKLVAVKRLNTPP